MKSILLASAMIFGLNATAFASNPAAAYTSDEPAAVAQVNNGSLAPVNVVPGLDKMTTGAIPSSGLNEGNYQTPLTNLPVGTRDAIYATGR